MEKATDSTATSDFDRRDTEVDDAVLIASARHDPSAFGVLYSRYVRPIYRYCYRRLGNHELAEDATSTTFVRAYAALHRYQDGTFRGWLFTIAERVVTDLLRKQRPQVGIDAAVAIPASEPNPEEATLTTETRATVQHFLSSLTDEQRRVVELRLAGLTGPEIARVLGKRPEAVKSVQFRAYTRLRKLLERATKGSSHRDG